MSETKLSPKQPTESTRDKGKSAPSQRNESVAKKSSLMWGAIPIADSFPEFVDSLKSRSPNPVVKPNESQSQPPLDFTLPKDWTEPSVNQHRTTEQTSKSATAPSVIVDVDIAKYKAPVKKQPKPKAPKAPKVKYRRAVQNSTQQTHSRPASHLASASDMVSSPDSTVDIDLFAIDEAPVANGASVKQKLDSTLDMSSGSLDIVLAEIWQEAFGSEHSGEEDAVSHSSETRSRIDDNESSLFEKAKAEMEETARRRLHEANGVKDFQNAKEITSAVDANSKQPVQSVHQDMTRSSSMMVDKVRAKKSRADLKRAEAARNEMLRAESVRADAAKAKAARIEANRTRVTVARKNAIKAEAARVAAARSDAIASASSSYHDGVNHEAYTANRIETVRAESIQRVEEAKIIEQAKRLEEAKRAEKATRLEEAKRAEEATRLEEAKQVEEAMRLEEAKQAEEAKRLEEAARAEEAIRLEEAERAEETKRIEEAKRVEEAKRIQLAQRAEEARRAEAVRQAEQAMSLEISPVDEALPDVESVRKHAKNATHSEIAKLNESQVVEKTGSVHELNATSSQVISAPLNASEASEVDVVWLDDTSNITAVDIVLPPSAGQSLDNDDTWASDTSVYDETLSDPLVLDETNYMDQSMEIMAGIQEEDFDDTAGFNVPAASYNTNDKKRRNWIARTIGLLEGVVRKSWRWIKSKRLGKFSK